MRSIALVISLTVLAVSAPASAATYYVANDCYGQPTPCTTDLQSALDNTRYDIVEAVANATFTGDYVITRSVDFRGNSGVTITPPTGSDYALRIESSTTVRARTMSLFGQVAIYDSTDVSFYTVDIDSGDMGIQIVDSSDILLRTTTVQADTRAVDAVDSSSIDLVFGSYDGGRYALVGSDASFAAFMTDLHGDFHTVVLQNGSSRITPNLDAEGTDLTAGAGQEHVYRWSSANTTYTSCTPSNPTELVSGSGDLVSVIGYTPYGGG